MDNITEYILKEKDIEKLAIKIGEISRDLLGGWMKMEKDQAVFLKKSYNDQKKAHKGSDIFMTEKDAESYRAMAYSIFMLVRSIQDEEKEKKSWFYRVIMPFS